MRLPPFQTCNLKFKSHIWTLFLHTATSNATLISVTQPYLNILKFWELGCGAMGEDTVSALLMSTFHLAVPLPYSSLIMSLRGKQMMNHILGPMLFM